MSRWRCVAVRGLCLCVCDLVETGGVETSTESGRALQQDAASCGLQAPAAAAAPPSLFGSVLYAAYSVSTHAARSSRPLVHPRPGLHLHHGHGLQCLHPPPLSLLCFTPPPARSPAPPPPPRLQLALLRCRLPAVLSGEPLSVCPSRRPSLHQVPVNCGLLCTWNPSVDRHRTLPHARSFSTAQRAAGQSPSTSSPPLHRLGPFESTTALLAAMASHPIALVGAPDMLLGKPQAKSKPVQAMHFTMTNDILEELLDCVKNGKPPQVLFGNQPVRRPATQPAALDCSSPANLPTSDAPIQWQIPCAQHAGSKI